VTTLPTEQQLDEIETRASKATPGPWRRSEDYSDIVAPDGSQLASYWMSADGEFIAHAPDDVRTLLDEVRRQRAENAQLRAARDVIASMHRDLDARLDAVAAFLDEQELAARAFELPTPAWVEAVRAASAPSGVAVSASPASGVSESAQSPTGAPEGPHRTLTEHEYNAAWHAVEGAAGDEGADPGTVLHAVLDRLGIEWQDAARPGRLTPHRTPDPATGRTPAPDRS
jgi:hypothetical protein